MVDMICERLNTPVPSLTDVVDDGIDTISTGDPVLDKLLGGGIRTGMLWEFAGEGYVTVQSD